MDYYDVLENHDLFPGYALPVDPKRAYRRYLSYMFKDVDLDGKRVLDVGAGEGQFSLYMAHEGADVLAIEPEFEGSSSEMYATLSELAGEYDTLSARPVTFQELDVDESFDLVFMHNVVNHLKEDACVRLHESEEARRTYRSIFESINDITAEGGSLLISDADRKHLYQYLGLSNPFTRSIEWEKHQSPRLWSRLLADSGFVERDVGWTPTAGLGPLAPLTANYCVSHLLRCQFRLVMGNVSGE
jgi:SAM-dependent methyltransferase